MAWKRLLQTADRTFRTEANNDLFLLFPVPRDSVEFPVGISKAQAERTSSETERPMQQFFSRYSPFSAPLRSFRASWGEPTLILKGDLACHVGGALRRAARVRVIHPVAIGIGAVVSHL